MLLLRLIFLVGPLLAVSFNTKSKESKKPELNEILTNNDLDAVIQKLEVEYNTAQNKLNDFPKKGNKARKNIFRNEFNDAKKRLKAAKGMNHLSIAI